ncbi:hypothetical protein BGP76_16610 [Reichenbachiella sp. MSK19-1]|nr:hypothetical protein BGP76_16610 [Reichenbachiella sp. MSK19-1]
MSNTYKTTSGQSMLGIMAGVVCQVVIVFWIDSILTRANLGETMATGKSFQREDLSLALLSRTVMLATLSTCASFGI